MEPDKQLLDVCAELLVKLREVPENQKCFDCSDKTSPLYVCTDYSTFVCSCCANIHKEFGHTIKCLNLFAFTLNEILQLRDSGNKLAAYKWLESWDNDSFPEPESTSLQYKEYARDYMRAKYVEKRWATKVAANQDGSNDYEASDASADDWSHLHDDKPPSPFTLRAKSIAANNPFASPTAYIQSPVRMSFPPQSGQSIPSITIDLAQINKIASSFPTGPKSPFARRAGYNPFADDTDIGREPAAPRSPLLRSATQLDLKALFNSAVTTTASASTDDIFKPHVRLRSASAHALLHSASAECFNTPIILPDGKELKLPSRSELKFPTKALPPLPTEKKSTPLPKPEIPAKPTEKSELSEKREESAAPASPGAASLPSSQSAGSLVDTPPKPATPESKLFNGKSPLRINALVKAFSIKNSSPAAASPTPEAAPVAPVFSLDGEANANGPDSPKDAANKGDQGLKGPRVVGSNIMNKMASLLRPTNAPVKS